MYRRLHRWLLPLLMLWVAAGLTLACAPDPTTVLTPLAAPSDSASLVATSEMAVPSQPLPVEPISPDRFRVVFIADSHIIGPNYECCESNTRDTQSIYRTQDRLIKTRDQINQIRPRPAFGILLGDVFHDGYPEALGEDLDAYLQEDTAMGRAAALLEGFEFPIYPLWGNHDYTVPRISQEFSHQIFQTFFDAEPYYSVDYGGWRFILANSQLGPTWDPDSPQYNKGMASYGAEQLDWIDQQLSTGKPSVVLSHYPLLRGITARNENPYGQLTDLPTVLSSHSDTVKLTLAGHFHHWLDFLGVFDFPHMVLGATRYDQDNFWLIEFDRQQGTYEILDRQKANWGRKTSDRWTYWGEPQPLVGDSQSISATL